MFEEHVIRTTGDAVQDRRLADIGGKGLFAKEIHEALADGRIDFAVHSLKDLETELPPGIVLACTLPREDARDALILGRGLRRTRSHRSRSPACRGGAGRHRLGAAPGAAAARAAGPAGRHHLRGNVQTRLGKLAAGDCAASLLALAGLRRLGLEDRASVVLDPDAMVPAAGQGIIGITVRADDTDLHELLAAIEDPEAKAVSTAERAMLAELDGSCRTPIGGHARLLPERATAPDRTGGADRRFLPAPAQPARPTRRTRRGSARNWAPACGPTAPAIFLADVAVTTISGRQLAAYCAQGVEPVRGGTVQRLGG